MPVLRAPASWRAGKPAASLLADSILLCFALDRPQPQDPDEGAAHGNDPPVEAELAPRGGLRHMDARLGAAARAALPVHTDCQVGHNLGAGRIVECQERLCIRDVRIDTTVQFPELTDQAKDDL